MINPIRISLVSLGNLKFPVSIPELESWKSKVISIRPGASVGHLPDSDGDQWEYPMARFHGSSWRGFALQKVAAEFHHVVMLHPQAIIGRPPTKDFDTSNVIKADQFPTWHQHFVDKLGTGTIFKSMFNLRNLV